MRLKVLAVTLAVTLAVFLLASGSGTASAHTIDSVGKYRVEIGWMNEPVVSNETNGIELFVSPLEPGLEPDEQDFKDGVPGLEKTIGMELHYKTDKIKIPFAADHNTPGMYYAFVNPTVSGFYQANILGTIKGTPISLSMHPPKVNERSYIEFPQKSDAAVSQIADEHLTLVDDVTSMQESVRALEQDSAQLGMVVMPVAIAALAAGILSIVISAKKRSARVSS